VKRTERWKCRTRNDEPNSGAGKTTVPGEKPPGHDGFSPGTVVFPALLFGSSFSSLAFSIDPEDCEQAQNCAMCMHASAGWLDRHVCENVITLRRGFFQSCEAVGIDPACGPLPALLNAEGQPGSGKDSGNSIWIREVTAPRRLPGFIVHLTASKSAPAGSSGCAGHRYKSLASLTANVDRIATATHRHLGLFFFCRRARHWRLGIERKSFSNRVAP